MTLEDIHHVWGEHVKVEQQQQQQGDGVVVLKYRKDRHPCKGWAPPRPRAGTLVLPSFLRAFTDLARAKYCRQEDDHNNENRAVTRLLLRDVFDNIATRSALRSEKTRYGVCAHLVHEDVCAFLLSQRSFTTALFATYAYGEEREKQARRDCRGVDKNQSCVQPPPSSYGEGRESVDSKWKLVVWRNSRMCWTDYLAVASDLQLIPRLMGIDALKVAMEQVSSAPHRMQARDGLGDLSGKHSSSLNGEAQQPKMGMLYPQFVESLSLLAAFSAERLRLFYPDIAGTNPCNTTPGAPKAADDESRSRARASARRNGRSAVDKYSQRALPGVGSGGKEERGRPRDFASNKTAVVRAVSAVQLVPGTSVEKNKAPVSSAATRQARQAERRLPYDLGALKALFHHARISYKENRSSVRIRARTDRPRPAGASSRHKAQATASEPRGCSASEQVVRAEICEVVVGGGLKGGARGAVAARSLLIGGGHENEIVSEPTDRLKTKVYAPADSAEEVVDVIAGRVSKIERENNFPSGFNDSLEGRGVNRQASVKVKLKLPYVGQARVDDHAAKQPLPPPPPPPPAVGAGGAFARLVVIKELQLVPEHAPADVRCLLELTLDHHQAGRYDLALKILDKARNTWRTLQGGGRSLPPATTHGGNKGALLRLMEGSICQSAGRDDDAFSALLRADEAVSTIHHQGDFFLRKAVTASLLGEMGVALYYCRRTALSLRCSRLALFLRQKLPQQQQCTSKEQDSPEVETVAATSDGGGGGGGGVAGGGMNLVPTRGSTTLPAGEAERGGRVAAAATLNNIGVCLAVRGGDASLARKVLGVSSDATT
ncbi:unnamed protein product [Laminaria digitata]